MLTHEFIQGPMVTRGCSYEIKMHEFAGKYKLGRPERVQCSRHVYMEVCIFLSAARVDFSDSDETSQ